MKLPRPNYYQGVLQLRNINQDVIIFVRNLIEKRDNVAITKTVNFPDGIDLYITSQKYIRMIGKKLKDSFRGELTISSRLHTKSKMGKDLYRVNALFKLHDQKVGDVVNVRGDDLKIIKFGKKIFAKDIKTGKKVTIRSSDLPQN